MAEIDDKELAELRKQAAAGAKAAAQAEALQGQLSALQAEAGKVKSLEEQLTTLRAAQVDATFTAAGITDAKVRRFFELEHAEVAAAEGGEKDLGKWLSGLQALEPDKRPAHLAPFLGRPAQGASAGGGQRTAAPPANGDKGAKGPAADAPTYTAEAIAKMGPEEFQQNFAAIAKEFPDVAAFAPLVAAASPTKP